MVKNQINNQNVLIDDFVSRLLQKRDLTNLEAEVIEQIKEDLKARVIDIINATIIEKMPPEKLGDFEKLLDSGSEEDVQNFCVNNILNLDNIIASTLSEFAEVYLK